eukprot:SAG31_NODE_153_length_22196_cov_24.963570_6_plen_354_part_00
MYNGKVVTQPPYVLICKVRNHTCEAQRAAQQWRDIQLELGTHWRQPIYIDSSNMTIDLANANPHIPLYYIISRGGDTILWNTSKVASTDSASRKCFVQNAVGNLLSVDGVALNMNTSIRPHEYASNGIFRPCVTKECATEAECPLEHLYNHDGSSWVQQFKQFAQNGLKRPINRLYDDGEIMSVWHMLNHALDQDPVMVRDYERVGIPLLAGGQRDWEAFTSKWRWLNTEGFRARFISDPELLTFDAEYSEYDVAGRAEVFWSHAFAFYRWWMSQGRRYLEVSTRGRPAQLATGAIHAVSRTSRRLASLALRTTSTRRHQSTPGTLLAGRVGREGRTKATISRSASRRCGTPG